MLAAATGELLSRAGQDAAASEGNGTGQHGGSGCTGGVDRGGGGGWEGSVVVLPRLGSGVIGGRQCMMLQMSGCKLMAMTKPARAQYQDLVALRGRDFSFALTPNRNYLQYPRHTVPGTPAAAVF